MQRFFFINFEFVHQMELNSPEHKTVYVGEVYETEATAPHKRLPFSSPYEQLSFPGRSRNPSSTKGQKSLFGSSTIAHDKDHRSDTVMSEDEIDDVESGPEYDQSFEGKEESEDDEDRLGERGGPNQRLFEMFMTSDPSKARKVKGGKAYKKKFSYKNRKGRGRRGGRYKR